MHRNELTIRGLILGALITTVFTAANVYLGLKVGLTFASSIPAAVISMAILSAVKDSSILENNIVQTVASAAGTLSAIIFVLPGLVIVGWWTGFPFWQSFLICVSGGVLGVLFTIPLRRALVTNSDLPVPRRRRGGRSAEGRLRHARRDEGRDAAKRAKGSTAVIFGSVASAGLAIVTRDAHRRRARSPASSASARIGVERLRHRVVARAPRRGTSRRPVGRHGDAGRAGDRVGRSPCRSSRRCSPPPTAWRSPRTRLTIWRTQVRFIGAGAIAVAAIYTLAKLAKPVVGGLVSTLASSRAQATGDERDRDLSPAWIVGAHGRVPGRSRAGSPSRFARPTVLAPTR